MTDSDELEALRERKRQELLAAASAPETPDTPVSIESEAQFQELLAENSVVLVDFYADWCGPCQMLAPTVEAIAAETDAAVAKVDIDANQSLAANYQVQGVPTLYLFVDGEPVERMVGVQEKGSLVASIESHS